MAACSAPEWAEALGCFCFYRYIVPGDSHLSIADENRPPPVADFEPRRRGSNEVRCLASICPGQVGLQPTPVEAIETGERRKSRWGPEVAGGDQPPVIVPLRKLELPLLELAGQLLEPVLYSV